MMPRVQYIPFPNAARSSSAQSRDALRGLHPRTRRGVVGLLFNSQHRLIEYVGLVGREFGKCATGLLIPPAIWSPPGLGACAEKGLPVTRGSDEIQAMGKAKEISRPTANRYLALVRAVLRQAAGPW